MFRKATKEEFTGKVGKLALDLIDFLLDKEMMDDTFIYVNGKRYGTYDGEKHYHYHDASWDTIYVEDDMNPKDYCEYAGNILSLSTEGFLYDCLNYGFEWGSKASDQLEAIFEKHGYYYEMCTAWFITAVKL